MTKEEADKIAKVISTADGGCHACVRSLAEEMEEAFPEYAWRMNEDDQVVVAEKAREGRTE